MNERPLWERYQDRLEALKELKINFDFDQSHKYTEAEGWNVDEYNAELPSEPPGEPQERGPWEIACRIVGEYRFPDPKFVRGVYFPDRPLDERFMLVKARFLFMDWIFGVKIDEVIDKVIEQDSDPVRVWGFSYVTLQGHFEQGRISFQVWKYMKTGRVFFHIESFSRADRIPNFFYRWGFRIFGRSLQKKFVDSAMSRMQNMVKEELRTKRRAEETLDIEVPVMHSSNEDGSTEQGMERLFRR